MATHKWRMYVASREVGGLDPIGVNDIRRTATGFRACVRVAEAERGVN